jgi:REP element-mobilizing transposase RayT
MANTYSRTYVHCVFAVKGREYNLHSSFRQRVFEYMSAVLKNDGVYPLAIGGWKDHVHIFFDLPTTRTISDIVRNVKAVTSKWINEQGFLKGKFSWQEGYGSFSHSFAEKGRVIEYIRNQEMHHAKTSFKEEYISFLKDYDISFDERYLFDFDT